MPPVVSVVAFVSSVTAPEGSPALLMITGSSLVPVMVTVTSWSTVPPWPSDTVTV